MEFPHPIRALLHLLREPHQCRLEGLSRVEATADIVLFLLSSMVENRVRLADQPFPMAR